MNKASQRRLAENQVVFRKANEQLKMIMSELSEIPAERGVESQALDPNDIFQFFCECSDENCRQRIELAYDKYEKIHSSNDTFVIISGHEVREIEDVIEKIRNYSVVQKHEMPSQTIETLYPTLLNNT